MASSNLVSRGVEAKEIENNNYHFEMDASEMSPHRTDSSATPASSDQTASYVQVIVQKQRRARLPAASSPVVTVPAPHGGPAGDEPEALPATVLLAYPTLAALQSAYGGVARGLEGASLLAPSEGKGDGKNNLEKFNARDPKKDNGKQDYSSTDDEGEVIEVLRLERAGAALAARGCAGPGGRVERAARRVRRRAGRLLRAALAFPRLLLDLPIDLILHLERCALEAVRGAAVGGAGALLEALGKPALAAAHNALVAALAVAAGVARGVREAVRPLAAALGDALEPGARLLGALRLVHVERVQHVHCARCPPCAADGDAARAHPL